MLCPSWRTETAGTKPKKDSAVKKKRGVTGVKKKAILDQILARAAPFKALLPLLLLRRLFYPERRGHMSIKISDRTRLRGAFKQRVV